jgi:hypothetical protein
MESWEAHDLVTIPVFGSMVTVRSPPVPETVMALAAASGVSAPSKGVPRALNFSVFPAKL